MLTRCTGTENGCIKFSFFGNVNNYFSRSSEVQIYPYVATRRTHIPTIFNSYLTHKLIEINNDAI